MECTKAWTGALLVAGSAWLTAAPAATMNFDAAVVDGPLAGITGSGSVTYDETLLDGSGAESIVLPGAGGESGAHEDETFSVLLALFGQIFTAADDTDFPGFPRLQFEDGLWVGLDFIVEEASAGNPVPIDLPGLVGFGMFDVHPGAGGNAFIPVSSTFVPLPASVGPLVLALAMSGALARRQRGTRRAVG